MDAVTVSGFSFNRMKRWMQRRRAPNPNTNTPDENTLNEFLNDRDVTIQIQQYIFLKLPFELYAGYNLAWSVSLLNIIVRKLFRSVVLSEVLACVSLVALLCVGSYIMWTEKKGLCYGVGVGVAWYLVSSMAHEHVSWLLHCSNKSSSLSTKILHRLEYSFNSSTYLFQ